jgi:hypothetical protein
MYVEAEQAMRIAPIDHVRIERIFCKATRPAVTAPKNDPRMI